MSEPRREQGRSADNQSVVRAVAVLRVVAGAPEGLTLSALARTVSLPQPTVSRLVRTLEGLRLLARLPGTRQVVLGLGVAELGAARVVARELLAAGRPHVEALAAQLGEAVELLQVVDDRADNLTDALETLVRVESIHILHAAFSRRRPIPVHVSSIGKLLLAHRRPEDVERVLSGNLVAFAPGSITDPEWIRRKVAEARTTGIAFASEEVGEGASGLAAQVLGTRGELLAILHVEGPSSRLGIERMHELTGTIMQTTASIGADFQALVLRYGSSAREPAGTVPRRGVSQVAG